MTLKAVYKVCLKGHYVIFHGESGFKLKTCPSGIRQTFLTLFIQFRDKVMVTVANTINFTSFPPMILR